MDFKREVVIGLGLTVLAVALSIFYVYRFNLEISKPLKVETKLPEVLTMEIVAKHNSKEDCWVVIDGKVADVTDYLELHPAGPESIIRLCGKDATTAFKNIKDGRGHSAEAATNFDLYVVGSIGLEGK